MTSVAKDIGMPEPSDADVDEVMNELDVNGDGKISQDEFKVLIKQVLELMAGEEDNTLGEVLRN